MVKGILETQEQTKNKFFKTQSERAFYLDEFKENIIISLNKKDLEDGILHPEIVEGMREPDAKLLKIRRDISIKLLKPYIDEAEKIGLRYTLIDGDVLFGEIALVVVSSEAMDNDNEDLVASTLTERFENAGLSDAYSKNIGKEICVKHYKELEEKLPLLKGSFRKQNTIKSLFGQNCPICEEEGGK
ncbi:MAG: DUF1694 domain-containing protein [Fusobacteriaceae bacterium]